MPASVTFGAGIDDDFPAPSANVVMTADGEFVSTAQQTSSGVVLKWAADGTFLGTYGRRGGGPGEFSGVGDLILLPGIGDSLFVVDDRSTWSVLDANLGFVRSFRGNEAGRSADAMYITANHQILSTGKPGGLAREKFFHVMDFTGKSLRDFGSVPESVDWQRVQSLYRLVAPSGKDSFWAAPLEAGLGGSGLEEWSLDGTLLRTIRRDVPWLPEQPYPPPDGEIAEPEVPYYGYLNVDDSGLLWVVVTVRDQGWISPRRLRRLHLPREEYIRRQYDTRLEVIDPDAGAVLASAVFDDPRDLPMRDGFHGTRTFYEVEADTLGFNSIRVFEVGLYSIRD